MTRAEVKARLLDRLERLVEVLLGAPSGGTKARPRFSASGKKGGGSLEVVLTGEKRGSWISRKGHGGGGPIQLIMHARSCGFAEAVEWARAWLGDSDVPWAPPARRAPDASAKIDKRSTYHLEIAEGCVPAIGTLAERYLREHRAITGALPSEVQFHPRVWHPESKRAWPAAVFMACDASSVRRLQVVFLDPATGAKAAINPAKKTMGADASHIPVEFAARHEGGPIHIVEGPEDAATIWSLTGDRTWAVLGSRSLAKPEAPPGSYINMCGDSTDEGRDAARRAAKHYVADGCRVDLAFATDGAKDFNEALQWFGPARTLEMLRAATPFRAHGLPPYYSVITESRDAALKRQNDAIAGTLTSMIRRGIALHEIDRHVAARVTDDMTPAAKAVVRRAVKRDVVANCGPIPTTRRILVTGSQGTGKTLTAVKVVAQATANASGSAECVVHVYQQTLAKAYETAADYIDHALPGSLPVMVVAGRGAPDVRGPSGSLMCPRNEVVKDAAAAGIEVRKHICPTCPLGGSCGSMRQDREIAAMGNRGVFIHAHSYLTHATPAPAADLVIIDEAAVIGLVNSVLELSPDAITDVLTFRGSELATHMAAGTTLATVARVLRLPNSLDELRRAGVTVDALRTVRGLLDDQIEAAKPVVDGAMSDDRIKDLLERRPASNLGNVAGLLSAIIKEIDQPRSIFNAITFHPARRVIVDGVAEHLPRTRVRRLRHLLNVTQDAGLLLMDGTGNHRLNEVTFGKLDHVHAPVERDSYVIGTRGKSYSRQSLTGRDRRGAVMLNKAAEATNLRGEIVTIYEHLTTMAGGGPGALFATKRAADTFRQEDAVPGYVGHFGAQRGRNNSEHCPFTQTVGRESVSIESLEDLTRALFATDPEPFISYDVPPPADWPWQQWPYRATRGRRMRGGCVERVEVEVHPDPRAQAVLEQIREADVVQTADRCRPIFNRRFQALLNNLVLDFTYDRTLTHEEFVAGGTRFDRAWRQTGILPLGAADLHLANPTQFPTESIAKDALREVRELGGLNQIDSLLGCTPKFRTCIFYRRRGRRGQGSHAWIDLLRHPDPAQALSAALGSEVVIPMPEGARPAPWPSAPTPAPPAPSPAPAHASPVDAPHPLPRLPPQPAAPILAARPPSLPPSALCVRSPPPHLAPTWSPPVLPVLAKTRVPAIVGAELVLATAPDALAPPEPRLAGSWAASPPPAGHRHRPPPHAPPALP